MIFIFAVYRTINDFEYVLAGQTPFVYQNDERRKPRGESAPDINGLMQKRYNQNPLTIELHPFRNLVIDIILLR